MNEEKTKNEEEHYICLGGCEGVSDTPGVCQTPDCMNHDHELLKCNCEDNSHFSSEPA